MLTQTEISFHPQCCSQPSCALPNQVHPLQLQRRGRTTTSRQHVATDRSLQAQQLPPAQRAVASQQRQGPQQQPNDSHHARHQHEPRHRRGRDQRLIALPPGKENSPGLEGSRAPRQVLIFASGSRNGLLRFGSQSCWELPQSSSVRRVASYRVKSRLPRLSLPLGNYLFDNSLPSVRRG